MISHAERVDRAMASLVCAMILVLIACAVAGCAPSTETLIKGDREVVQVTAGALKNGSGDARLFYILRDKDTGVDYLAVVDAGIVKLEPKPVAVQEVEK